MGKKYKLGDEVSIDFGTTVTVELGILKFKGVIVGKSSTDINQSHIVKCIDGTIPNNEYKYDSVSVPLSLITLF